MDTTSFCEMLTKYGDNYIRQAELGESLFRRADKQDWQDNYCHRAVELGRLYEENEQIIRAVSKALEEPLDEETAELIYRKMADIISNKNCSDLCLFSPVIKQLCAYYESSKNHERLIRTYELAAIALIFFASADSYLPFNCYEYMEKILALTDEYESIKEARGRLSFFCAYSVLCSMDSAVEYLGINKAYQYFRDMIALWESEKVQRLDGEDPMFQQYVEIVQNQCLNCIAAYLKKTSPEEIKEFFFRFSDQKIRQEMSQKDKLFQYDYKVYETHLHMSYLRGELSREESVQKLYEYYRKRIAHFHEEANENQATNVGKLSIDEINFLLGAPVNIIKWTKQCGKTSLPDDVIDTILDGTRMITYKMLLNTSGRENEVDLQLAEYCFTLLPFLRTLEEKEEWLFELIVYRQLPSYIHCSMVKRLADVLFEEMYRDKPELFGDVSTLIDPSELPEFIGKCALFHDVGKNMIAGVINIQTRAILDNEFDAIRRHPRDGYRFVCDDPDFSRYKDIILGHHKFYNGQGGYPEDFDNTSSPYCSAIDLITICDCMDAATDALGRNYKKAKTVDDVLTEFDRDKGVRYNPDMVDYILHSDSLRQKLRRVVSEDRLEIAYEIYEKFLT